MQCGCVVEEADAEIVWWRTFVWAFESGGNGNAHGIDEYAEPAKVNRVCFSVGIRPPGQIDGLPISLLKSPRTKLIGQDREKICLKDASEVKNSSYFG